MCFSASDVEYISQGIPGYLKRGRNQSVLSMLCLSILLLSCLFINGCVSSGYQSGAKGSIDEQIPAHKSVIYVYRSVIFVGMLVPFDIYIDNKLIGTLTNSQHFKIEVTPGNHVITAAYGLRAVGSQEKAELRLRLTPGKAAYLRADAAFGVTSAPTVQLVGVDEAEGLGKIHATRLAKLYSDFTGNQEHGQQLTAAPLTKAAESSAFDRTGYRPSLPVIVITSPDVQRSLKVVEKSSALTVIGKASDERGVADVRVNGKQAVLDEQGNFSAEVLLKVGENRITVIALNTQGSSETRTFSVSRPPGGTVATAETAPVAPSAGITAGKYYALLIAVQDYSSPEINRLEHPIADAVMISEILTSQYTFDERNITLLKNPDRKAIGKAFNDLRGKLTSQDSLMVFYAGHGVWMEDMREGYWLPRDASGANDPTDWIANSTIRNQIRALKAKHVLLVADACFSGGIFRVRDAFANPATSIEKIYEMTSRKAITSGSLKTVPDRSVFVEYLAKRLKDNQDKYLDAQKLFVSFKEAVINNSPNNQTPLYGAINEAGDEGGDFVFVKK